MNIDKYAMLKATLKNHPTISISLIKSELNVNSDEADEMLRNLIQEGLVDPFSMDGRSYRVL